MNGDGFDDMIVSAPSANPNGSFSGSSYLLFGGAAPFASVINLSTIDGTIGVRLDGGTAGDQSGTSVSGAGDVNGDGFDDWIVGSPYSDPIGVSSGRSYVVFGSNLSSGVEMQVAGDGSQILNATLGAGVDVLIGGRGDDTLISDGGDDVLRGGEGNDVLAIPDVNFSPRRLQGGTGTDTLRLDGFGLTLDLRTIADNRITGIEQIDLNDGENRLIVTPREILRLSGSSNALNVQGGTSNRVFVQEAGWVSQGTVNIDGTNYDQFTNGAATLNIETDVAVTFSVLGLGTLDGTTGFRLDGAAGGDFSGRAVSGAGDVNGDGFEDLFIGAASADPNGNSGAGSSYVLFGRSGGFASAIELSSLDGTTGFRLDGVATGDQAGSALSGAGDVNGDGFADLIVGARLADPNGISSGSTFVIFGHSGPFASVIDLNALDGATGFRLDGVAGSDLAGGSVSGAGDHNGDGYQDLLVGAFGADPNGSSSGSTYILFGRSGGFASAVNLSTLDGTNGYRLDGALAGDRSGISVSSAGDVNGDGFDDLLIGAEGADSNGNSSGSTYVVFGRSGSFTSAVSLSTVDGTIGFRLDGAAASENSGYSVSGAGDFNGDGFDDLIIGAYGATPNGEYSGSSYVFFGRSGGFASAINLSTLDGTTGFRLDGDALENYSGISVSGAGDVNGDGLDDLFIGAHYANPNGIQKAGSSYVLFGRSGSFDSVIALSSLDGTNGFRLDGAVADDSSGRSVSGAGDFNGDGFDDLLVGAYQADPNGLVSGSSYIVFGGNFTGGPETLVAGDGSQTLNAALGAGVDILIGGRGDDTLVSDGGDDVLRGGEGDDVLAIPDVNFSPRRLQGGTGTDTLRLDGAGLTLDLRTIADNRITGIEVIDLNGGDNLLFVTSGEVLRLSGASNTLNVQGGPFDRVYVQGAGWSPQGTVNIDGTDYNQYANGAATLNVQTDVAATLAVVNLSTLSGTTGFSLKGAAAQDRTGWSVSDAGDVNGDGFDDVIVGAFCADPNGSNSGSSYVVFGRSGGFASAIELNSLDGTTGFRLDGVAADDFSGISVSGAGDVNGDGFQDLIIGAEGADSNGNSAAGSTYVLFGRSDGFASVVNVSTLDGTTGFRLDGVDPLDRSGVSVSGAGDLNGDGFDDLIVGAFSADSNGLFDAGSTYVVFGRSGPFTSVISLSTLDGTTGFRLDGAEVVDRSGTSVSGAGDVNGDGYDDLLVGAHGANTNGVNSGASYLVFGRSSGFASVINLSTLEGPTGFRLDGEAMYDGSGWVSSAGDVNGDGFDDLIVGADDADPNGNDSGAAYVVFGGNFTGGAEMQISGGGSQILNAALGADVDVLIAGSGNDTLVSDGGGDVLRAGEGDDVLALTDVDFSGTRRLVGGSGLDTLRLDAAGLVLDLTTIPDNRITGIEQIDLRSVGVTTLVLNPREVLNISDESNTLTVFENGDHVVLGVGWTQQPNQIVDGVDYRIYRHGEATLRITNSLIVELPSGNGSDDVSVRRNAGFVEVFDNNSMIVLDSVATADLSSVVIRGTAGESNRVVVDYSFGGFFAVPSGVAFFGAAGGTDTLEVVGTGTTLATLVPASGTLAAGTLTTRQAGSQTAIAFTEIEPLTATGLTAFDIAGSLDVAAQTLTVESTAFVETGAETTLNGGTLDVLNGVFHDGGRVLHGAGLVDGRVFADGGSQIVASGGLTIGDATSFAGFFSDGQLLTDTHTVTLLDANEAVLGSLTVLGSGGMSGTLTAANGFLLEEGKNLTGQGTVNGEFHNDGHVFGGGTGVVFNDLVTGIGTASNVTYNGGFSPGHSPAEVALSNTANLSASNTLFIELGGLTPGGQFDRLASTGTVNVDGTLDVSFINGFVPANGDSFEIIGASAVNGTFDTVNLPTLPLGLEWNVVYAADSVTLDVFALATAVTDTAFNAPAPNPNRSGIGTLDVLFDLPVNVAGVTSLSLFNHTSGQPVNIATATLSGNGTPLVSWDLSSLTLPDGRYTAEVTTSQVTTTVGGPLASTYAIEFHVLRGDLDGDAIVNFNDTAPLSVNFGQTGAAYRDGDSDGDGLVNFNDTTPLSLNFGASLAPLTHDFGDAPETGTSFPTTLANNGARHVTTGNSLFLGATRDAESDGQPNATASGDGLDEDGISVGTLDRGTNVAVTVTSSGAGFVNGWVDFNADGDWDDAGEQVFKDQPVVAGANGLQISVPAGATLGSTFARFRLTGSAGYSYFGLAPSGEVEDYQLTVADPAPDAAADTAEENLAHTDPTPFSTLLDRLFAIPVLALTTFEDPALLVSVGRSPLRGGP